MKVELSGARVTVVGLGQSGLSAARLAIGRGARVTINDARSAAELVARAKLILLDFDGPVCSVFAGLPAAQVAERLRDVIQDVEQHMETNGPWKYKLSQLYESPEVTEAVEAIAAEKHPKIAA